MTAERTLRMAYLVASVAGIGFFLMSVLLLGVWPSKVLEDQIAREAPGPGLILTESEQRGRRVYSREGCAYCHTQQIRYVAQDVARFGAATLAWETNLDYPHLWGTRRIGPDLSREAGVRSDDWQRAHLFAPRDIVPDSVMPAFPHLFNGAPDRPSRDGLDLLAYLETLGRARELAGPEGEAHALETCNCDEHTRMHAFGAPELNTHPAKARRTGTVPELRASTELDRGRKVYAQYCVNCHGASGRGDGPGAKLLKLRPASFAAHSYTLRRLATVLWNGAEGTAMAAWRDLPTEDLAAVAAVIREFEIPQEEPDIPPGTLELGRQVYEAHCVQCHGERGAGDGTAAARFPVPATDFRGQRPNLAASLEAVRNGVAGSPMAPWSLKLTEAEVSAAAYYVRRFFEGENR